MSEDRIDEPITVEHEKIHENGVFWNLSEEDYHAAFAVSAHGVNWLRMSGYDFWARCRALNPEYQEENDSEAKKLGRAFDARICEGRDVFRSRYARALDKDDYPEALDTREELHEALARHLVKLPKNTLKADLITTLLRVQPDAVILGSLFSEHAAQHAGKILLPGEWMTKIEVAAAFIENDPELSRAFSGGAAQVSVFWVDDYGIPRKSRFDYWKYRVVTDLKTTARDYMPIKRAFARDIAVYRYYIQAAYYLEAAEVAREFVRRGEHYGNVSGRFVDALMTSSDPYRFLWVIQRKGVAPMAKGMYAPPLNSATMARAQYEIYEAKQTFMRCWRTFGATERWIDPEGIDEYTDEDLPIRYDD